VNGAEVLHHVVLSIEDFWTALVTARNRARINVLRVHVAFKRCFAGERARFVAILPFAEEDTQLSFLVAEVKVNLALDSAEVQIRTELTLLPSSVDDEY
jgi:hypothetical protein